MQENRVKTLKNALRARILVLDGAMGTAIQDLNLSADDFGGATTEGCNEYICLTRPELILKIHETHLEAGADIIETNTFGGVPFVLDEFGLGNQAHEINFRAAELARQAADKISTSEHPRFVAGSMGPTTKAISVTGGISFEDLKENYFIQAKALYEGGADYFLIETCQDTRNVKAALLAIDQVHAEKKSEIPIAVSVTIEPMGTMLAGQSVEAVYTALSHRELLYIGLNCATGPEFMTDHLRSLSEIANTAVACVPNAGLPDEDGQYLETPEILSKSLRRFLDHGWVNLIGGCCGTTSKHTQALAELAKERELRKIPEARPSSTLSGTDFLEITDEMRPVLVGERTNVIGSRKFKRLIQENQLDEAAEIAKKQIKKGAHIVDICLANPDRDEVEDMRSFMEAAIQKIRAPLMIDSTDENVIDLALTYSQGKAIINSINLEDGEERFEKVVPLGKRYGAAFVVGTIDEDPEQGMGVTRERKLEIAKRSYKLLTEKYGIPASDLYFDPLVFPCGTGDEQYVGSAVETIEGVRLIKETFPECKTVLGISNVSFGLPPAGREVLNSVFLYHCVQAGLDLAIVNSEKLERYASLSNEEKKVSEDLLWNRGDDPIATFTAHFREKKPVQTQQKESLPLDERLALYIIEGTKDGLVQDLEEKLKTTPPLEIINGPLMKGMDEVGRLFNNNQLIVAEVLQSAEAMKAAVAHLEPLMDKDDSVSSSRGKVILATVKGDVHDIGKNLVEIILSNNGFNVVNLGIKVLPETLIAAAREHQPQIIGLSGLLVKSAQMMTLTAGDLSKAGIDTPILVGGAALSEKFTDTRIAPAYNGTVAYAKDAMTGLDLAKSIVDPEAIERLRAKLESRRSQISSQPTARKQKVTTTERSQSIELLDTPPQPQDFKRHIIRSTPIEEIFRWINPLMLYTRHLGLRGNVVRRLIENENDRESEAWKTLTQEQPKAVEVFEAVEKIREEYRQSPYLKPKAVYQFVHAHSEGNQIHLSYENGSKTAYQRQLVFPRQPKADGLCLSDYIHTSADAGDNLCLFVTTVGEGLREHVEELKAKGEYLKTHILQVLAFESAEGYAELLHSEIRKFWGEPDPESMTQMDRFQAKYRGKRYSFGYPACPRLDDQDLLFKILKPEEIGVQLTDGFMMDPEASVSAIVFHHPQATYFSAGEVSEASGEMASRY